jgi:hypothetical protein
MPIISGTLEVEIGRLRFEASLAKKKKKIIETLSQGMSQEVVQV